MSMTPEEMAAADAEYDALPGTPPNCYAFRTRAEIEESGSPRAAIQQMRDKMDGCTFFRMTEVDGGIWVEGWDIPPRSRCWMCPNQGPAEWADLEKNWPADNAKAIEFEREVQKRDPTIYLHDAKASGGDCMSGLCFT